MRLSAATEKNSIPRRVITVPGPHPVATRIVRLPGSFSMHRGGELAQVDVAYETWGKLSPARDNVVLLFTGLSPSAHAASSEEDSANGWWEYMIGPGKPIDTDHYYVICVNSLGSCFGSTGPASIDPSTGEPYRLNFPNLCVEDIASAAHEALRSMDIHHVCSVVGASLGGMASLAYAIQFPDTTDSMVSICGATRSMPFTIALRSLQREIIRNDPVWNEGNYTADAPPVSGMKLARKLGVISYRSAEEWHQRFDRDRVKRERDDIEPFGIEFEAEAYLEYQANKFIGTFDANCYLYLSRAMDWFDVAEHGGAVEEGLSRIQAQRTLLIGVETDLLFPVAQQEAIASSLRGFGRDVTFSVLPSLQGHDAFLVDAERFGPIVEKFFKSL